MANFHHPRVLLRYTHPTASTFFRVERHIDDLALSGFEETYGIKILSRTTKESSNI